MKKDFPTINRILTGIRIRQLLAARDISVKEAAEYLGFPNPQAVYHWISGRNLPTVDNLYALSHLLEIPMDLIVCGNKPYGDPQTAFLARTLMYWSVTCAATVA